jgi:hypothetical protein
MGGLKKEKKYMEKSKGKGGRKKILKQEEKKLNSANVIYRKLKCSRF